MKTTLFTILLVAATAVMAAAQPAKPLRDDGVTHPLHKKYLGKILFAKTDMPQSAMQEDKFTQEFTLGDLIYFRPFMKRSLVNALVAANPSINAADAANKAYYKIGFSLDGGEVFETRVDFGTDKSEKQNWTTWRGALKHSRDEGFVGLFTMREFFGARNITPGKHTVTVTLTPAYEELRGEPVTGQMMLTVNRIDPADTSYCMPAAQSIDAGIEALVVQAFKAKGSAQPKKVVLTSPGWTVVKDEVSRRIEKRHIGALVVTTAGDKCMVQDFWVAQDYGSGGGFGAAYLSRTGTQSPINCGCVK
jgi:hypothetical protein